MALIQNLIYYFDRICHPCFGKSQLKCFELFLLVAENLRDLRAFGLLSISIRIYTFVLFM